MVKAKISYINKPRDLVVKEVELPDPRGAEVLVKIRASGICGSDVECYEGKSAEGRFDLGPYTMGHEWAGDVVQIGSEVKNVKVGDKVTGECVLACGYCLNCRNGLMPSACLNMREERYSALWWGMKARLVSPYMKTTQWQDLILIRTCYRPMVKDVTDLLNGERYLWVVVALYLTGTLRPTSKVYMQQEPHWPEVRIML